MGTKIKLGDLIRRRRRELNMTQMELAKLIGVRDSYITKIEKGRNRGSYLTLAKIAMVLKIAWQDMIDTGEVEIPELTAGNESLYPYLDEQFKKYHPKTKEILYEIAPILEKYL